MELWRCRINTPLGPLRLAATAKALRAAAFASEDADSHDSQGGNAVLRLAREWFEAYFAGGRPDPRLIPLDPLGSAFDLSVWTKLLAIPYGQTLTYGGIARRLAAERGLARMSARAVGGAAGRNPIAIIIPCHRVIGAGGRLTGYAAGLERKARLLALEGWLPE